MEDLTRKYDFQAEKVGRWTHSIKHNFIKYAENLSDKQWILDFQGISLSEYESWLQSEKNHGSYGLRITKPKDKQEFLFEEKIVNTKNIYVNLDDNHVMIEGLNIPLTEQQVKIFFLLASNLGLTVDKTTIINALYGMKNHSFKVIDISICRIRKHLENTPFEIKTVWGRGYKLEAYDGNL